MKTPVHLLALALASSALLPAQTSAPARKSFIDYFLPTPILAPLSIDVWGAAEVGPRDVKNGIEDPTARHWSYWDGQILQAKDGKYHLFASRWDQALGHDGWKKSQAVHAVSENLLGPYEDKGPCWPLDQQGKGHNVTALALRDGRYAIVVSETRPGEVYVSDSLDGPWQYLGKIQVEENGFGKTRMSNVSLMVRPDGDFQIVARSGAVLISKSGVLGPYTTQGPSIYRDLPEISGYIRNLEDPVVWHSGGLYHIVVNDWYRRVAYHLTSEDGIANWTYRGVAYDPRVDFVRHTDGTVNRWHKYERPGVVLADGRVVAVTLAVLDLEKKQELGHDAHSSKIIVVPFDGAALERDLPGPRTP